jgi:hypothetical protein
MSDIIDALDVAQKIRDYTLTQSYGDTFRFELNCKESAALVDSYAAERERIARADEREKCAERAVLWLIEDTPDGEETFAEVIVDLRAAIKKDGK